MMVLAPERKDKENPPDFPQAVGWRTRSTVKTALADSTHCEVAEFYAVALQYSNIAGI